MTGGVAVRRRDVREILDATLPGYRGRKIRVCVVEKVVFHDTNWSGGTRNSYVAVHLSPLDLMVRPLQVPAPWFNPVEGESAELPMNCLVVEHSIFCGKDAGVTIYCRPENAPRLLPQAEVR